MKSYSLNTSYSRHLLILLTIIWPFAALFIAIRKFRLPYARTLFFLFCVYFGYTFIIPENSEGAPDSARYAEWFTEIHSKSIASQSLVNELVEEIISGVDFYQPIVTVLVSRFTGNPQVLFMVFAFVFGYFLSRNIWIVLDRIKIKVGFSLFVFILTFALINQIGRAHV